MKLLLAGLESVEKAEQFRANRLEKINNGEAWGSLHEKPYGVVHWLPISKEALFNPNDHAHEKVFNIFTPTHCRMQSRKEPNLDGVRFYCDSLSRKICYRTSIFHSGQPFDSYTLFTGSSSAEEKIPTNSPS